MSTDIDRFKLSRPGLIPIKLWNEFVDMVHSALITSFVGGSFARTPMGTQLYASGGGSSANGTHPFRIITQGKPDSTTGELQWGIAYDSKLFTSFQPQASYAITGLLTLASPTATDTGWSDLYMSADDAIWLEMSFDTYGGITSAEIKSWGAGDDFDITAAAWSENAFVEDDGATPPVFKTYRMLIGYSEIVDGQPVITQLTNRHQILIPRAIVGDGLGRIAMTTMDYQGGYFA